MNNSIYNFLLDIYENPSLKIKTVSQAILFLFCFRISINKSAKSMKGSVMKEICDRLINSGKTVMDTIKGHLSAFNSDISTWPYRSMISFFCINRTTNFSLSNIYRFNLFFYWNLSPLWNIDIYLALMILLVLSWFFLPLWFITPNQNIKTWQDTNFFLWISKHPSLQNTWLIFEFYFTGWKITFKEKINLHYEFCVNIPENLDFQFLLNLSLIKVAISLGIKLHVHS